MGEVVDEGWMINREVLAREDLTSIEIPVFPIERDPRALRASLLALGVQTPGEVPVVDVRPGSCRVRVLKGEDVESSAGQATIASASVNCIASAGEIAVVLPIAGAGRTKLLALEPTVPLTVEISFSYRANSRLFLAHDASSFPDLVAGVGTQPLLMLAKDDTGVASRELHRVVADRVERACLHCNLDPDWGRETFLEPALRELSLAMPGKRLSSVDATVVVLPGQLYAEVARSALASFTGADTNVRLKVIGRLLEGAARHRVGASGKYRMVIGDARLLPDPRQAASSFGSDWNVLDEAQRASLASRIDAALRRTSDMWRSPPHAIVAIDQDVLRQTLARDVSRFRGDVYAVFQDRHVLR